MVHLQHPLPRIISFDIGRADWNYCNSMSTVYLVGKSDVADCPLSRSLKLPEVEGITGFRWDHAFPEQLILATLVCSHSHSPCPIHGCDLLDETSHLLVPIPPLIAFKIPGTPSVAIAAYPHSRLIAECDCLNSFEFSPSK